MKTFSSQVDRAHGPRQIRAFRVFLVRAGYGANMPKQPRSRWAIPLVVLTALWGLVLIVMTAFLIAMSLNGQPFSPSALIAGAAVAFGAFITLAPVLSWLRNLGNQRLGVPGQDVGSSASA